MFVGEGGEEEEEEGKAAAAEVAVAGLGASPPLPPAPFPVALRASTTAHDAPWSPPACVATHVIASRSWSTEMTPRPSASSAAHASRSAAICSSPPPPEARPSLPATRSVACLLSLSVPTKRRSESLTAGSSGVESSSRDDDDDDEDSGGDGGGGRGVSASSRIGGRGLGLDLRRKTARAEAAEAAAAVGAAATVAEARKAAAAAATAGTEPATASIDVLLFFSIDVLLFFSIDALFFSRDILFFAALASSSHSNSCSSSAAFGLLRGSLRSIAAIVSLAADETCRHAAPLNSGSSSTIARKTARSVSPRKGGIPDSMM